MNKGKIFTISLLFKLDKRDKNVIDPCKNNSFNNDEIIPNTQNVIQLFFKTLNKDSILNDSSNSNAKLLLGKYKVYSSSCLHAPNRNIVNIYSCCDKAYNCYICHNESENHRNSYSYEGYCIKCRIINEGDKENCKKCFADFSRININLD